MKNFWIQLPALVVFIFLALYFAFQPGMLNFLGSANQQARETRQVKINEIILNVEVADDASKRAQGLGGRENLSSESGMLFVFSETKKHQFWMKGMKFPLDFIFIRNGKVVDLLSNVAAPVPGQSDSSLTIYEPVVPIDMLLEINAGFIDAHRIRVGDNIYRLNQ